MIKKIVKGIILFLAVFFIFSGIIFGAEPTQPTQPTEQKK